MTTTTTTDTEGCDSCDPDTGSPCADHIEPEAIAEAREEGYLDGLAEYQALWERFVHHLANDMRERAGEPLLPRMDDPDGTFRYLYAQAGLLAANGPRS